MTIMNNRRVISNPDAIREFLFAGRALFTLKSRKTEARFTFKVKASKDKKVFFVHAKRESSFFYLGYIRSDSRAKLLHTKKSKFAQTEIQFVTLAWYLKYIGHEASEFWHEGRCAHCSKRLTVPESILTGFGPICRGKKVTKDEVKKIQAKQTIDSINALINGRVKMNDPNFANVVKTAQEDIAEAKRREKFETK